MHGCQTVFHTASPFAIRVKDAQKDLIEPAKNGTRNVLTQASETPTVKRVVLTSSCAAIYGDNIDLDRTPSGKFTEEIWNQSSTATHQPYSYSKTIAEKEAWRIANGQSQWDLVTINPSFILGPGLNPHATNESNVFVKQLADGTMKAGMPKYCIGVVDVRDVANAHVQAAFRESASGRHIVSGHNTEFLELASLLKEQFPQGYPFPQRQLPKWLVWAVGPIVDKAMTRQVISKNVGKPWIGDNGKSKTSLGMNYRSLKETVVDHFQQFLANGVIKSKS